MSRRTYRTLGFGLLTRREMLQHAGRPAWALWQLGVPAGGHALWQQPRSRPWRHARPHFTPKAKRLIHIFANGGPSQVDLFDPKPLLQRFHGKPIPREVIPGARDAQASSSPAFASPYKFQHCRGKSGIEVRRVLGLPHLGEVIDDICVIRSMYADDISHDGGIMFMNTGAARLSRPSLGSWLTYGLGTENRNLPGFIALCPDGYPLNETQNWQSAFLPGVFQGTFINSKHDSVDKLIENIRNQVQAVSSHGA